MVAMTNMTKPALKLGAESMLTGVSVVIWVCGARVGSMSTGSDCPAATRWLAG